METRRWIALAGIVAGAALTLAGSGPDPTRASASPGLARRLLGPLATVVADVELIRAEAALDAGDAARGYAHVDRALRLDPEAEEAFGFLAYHLIYGRASEEREPDPERRLTHVRDGLAVLTRGMETVRRPEVLEFQRAVALLAVAARAEDGVLDWPGGPAAARRAAAEDLASAAARGHAAARELLAPPRAEPEHGPAGVEAHEGHPGHDH